MTYSISTLDGDHLGFVLLAGGPDSGDCLVRSISLNKQIEESPESIFLDKLQDLGELSWERIGDEFQIFDPEGNSVLVEKGGRMVGAGHVYMVEMVSQ